MAENLFKLLRSRDRPRMPWPIWLGLATVAIFVAVVLVLLGLCARRCGRARAAIPSDVQ
jgi:hypothetical protein